jgi:hypothetical protein
MDGRGCGDPSEAAALHVVEVAADAVEGVNAGAGGHDHAGGNRDVVQGEAGSGQCEQG